MGAPEGHMWEKVLELSWVYDWSEPFFANKPAAVLAAFKRLQEILCHDLILAIDKEITRIESTEASDLEYISLADSVEDLLSPIRDVFSQINPQGNAFVCVAKNKKPNGADVDSPQSQGLLAQSHDGINDFRNAHRALFQQTAKAINVVVPQKRWRIMSILESLWFLEPQSDVQQDTRIFVPIFDPVIAHFQSKWWVLDGEITKDNAGVPIEFILVKQGMSIE